MQKQGRWILNPEGTMCGGRVAKQGEESVKSTLPVNQSTTLLFVFAHTSNKMTFRYWFHRQK